MAAENRIPDEQKLGFHEVCELIAASCKSAQARKAASELRFLNDFETVVRLQEENEECRKLLSEGIQIPSCADNDLQEFSFQLEIEDFVPEISIWPSIIRSLSEAGALIQTLQRHKARFVRLYELCESMYLPPELLARLEDVFESDGSIRDHASPELNRLRKKKIDEQSKLRRKLEQALKSAVGSGFSPDDAGITIRNGRLVIPVLAEHKRRVRGFIHDESATGQTVYTEPEEALEANNAIREIQFAENREIQRILLDTSQFMRPQRSVLAQAGKLLYRIDLIRAKCLFGMQIGSCLPAFHREPAFSLSEAKHPLLLLAHRKKKLPLVPLRIWLTYEKRVLIISGPNAGGKSVCLKTVGLLQWMWQAGIPVSVGEGSRMGFFRNIMADIGDQQSLENDLSTYSSHLNNMNRMLQSAGSETLVLLDEFGNGTDPALGGPIAEAILEALCHKKVWGLVNTHYTNLKNFAGKHPACENAAMKFNPEKMEALFELEIGQPGSSFALEIAEKTGLPKAVLNQARNKTGVKKIKLDQLLSDLEREKLASELKTRELRDREKGVRLLENEYREKSNQLNAEKKAIMEKARQEAAHLLEETNRKIEETIRLIREAQAEKTATQKLRLSLQAFREEIQSEEEPTAEEIRSSKKEETAEHVISIPGEISEGDLVRIRGSESAGKVLRIRGKQAEIEMGEIRTSIQTEKLEKINRMPGKETPRSGTRPNLSGKIMAFRNQLDIRGLRADEALRQLEAWMDEAILLDQRHLRILHGKGNGILRNLSRNFLRAYPQVNNIRDEHADSGGAGVTLFDLK
jgi:DNA mismatch repair protein MutS2